MRNTGPVAMAAALCVMSACASHRASVPPEKINGTGIGAVSDPAKVNDNGSSSTSSTYANNGSYSNSTSTTSSYSTANNGSTSYNSTDSNMSSSSTSVVQGTPTTTSSTTVRQVPLPNSSLPCESVTASTRPASAVTFYTLDPVTGIYLPAGTMSSAPSDTTSYYTYDTGNGWYTVSSSTTSGGTAIYVSDPSNSTRMIPAGYAVVSTRPCGSAYVVTTTTTTSTPVHVETTTNTTPAPPPPMTSSASTTYVPPTIVRSYRPGRSSASLDVFATRLQFSGANADNMFVGGSPSTGTLNTSFERQNGWGLAFNGRLARMAELSIGGAYVKPQVNYTPSNFNNVTLNGGDLTVIPLDATLRFHLLPEAFIDPYLGGGATYMMFRDQNFNTFNNGLGGTGLQSVSFDNAFGWHAEGGVLFSFGHGFGINATARYNTVKPDVTSTFLNTDGSTTTSKTSFNLKPWQFNVGLRFGF